MGAAVLLFVALIPSTVSGQAAQAPPFSLPLETYPAAMRTALSQAEREARANPGDAAGVGAVGRLLHAWEQWEPAHEAYARAATLAPGVLDWQYLDACVLERAARHEEATARLRRAVAIAPDYLPARVKLAEALLNTGQIAESRTLFEALLGEAASEPAARFGLGRIAAAEGRHTDAVPFFKQALALFPEWGAAHYALALSLRALGRRDEAQQAMERHEQYGARWPAIDDRILASVSSLRDDATSDLRRAEALAEAGNLAGAIAANEAALARDPSLGVAHERLVTQYGRVGNWEQAEAHYREALRIGFNLADVYYDHGVLLMMQGKWDLAAEAFRKACDVNPLHAQAHNNLGQILERTAQFDAALEEYRQAINSKPTFRLARFNAARSLIALGRPAEAVAELARITEPRDAEAPRYLFALAVAHIRAGNRQEGLKWAVEARALAAAYGQTELATAIEKELERLK
jgi:tetratricopeptide (TPR) repeat protein